MNWDQERLIFAENEARRLNYAEEPATGRRELTRYFPLVIEAALESALTFARKYVSAGNYPHERMFIDNPQADGKVYQGRWRHVSTRASGGPKPTGFVQILRYGWADAVLTDKQAPNDECFILEAADTNVDARTMVFAWHSVARDAVTACLDSLRAAGAFVNPQVQGEDRPGTWQLDAINARQTEDGSYLITAGAIRVATVSALKDFESLTPVRERVREILAPFGQEGGYTEIDNKRTGYRPTEGIRLTYRALNAACREFLENMSDHDMRQLLPEEDRNRFEFVKKQVVADAEMTVKLVAEYLYVPLKKTTPESEARYVSLTRNNQSGKLVLVRAWPRIDPAAADKLLIENANPKVTAETVTDPQADGKVYTGDWLARVTRAEETDNEGVRLVQSLTKMGDQSVDVVTGTSPDQQTHEFYRFDVSAADVADFLDEKGVDPKRFRWSVSEPGITKLVKISAAEDGSLTLYALYATTEGLAHTDLAQYGEDDFRLTVAESAQVTAEREWASNVPVALLRQIAAKYGESAPNVRHDFQITRRDTHTFDFAGVTRTIAELDSGEFVAGEDAARRTRRRLGANLSAATVLEKFAVPESVPAGVRYELEAKPNSDGTTDAVLTTEEVKNQTGQACESTPLATTVLESRTAAESALSPETAVAGQKIKAESQPTPHGRFATRREETTAHAVVGTAYVAKRLGKLVETVQEYRHATAPPDADDGEIVEARLNDFARYDAIKRSLALSGELNESKRCSSVATCEWDANRMTVRTPRYSVSSNPLLEDQIGWDYWEIITWRWRTVTTEVEEEYSLSYPTVTTAEATAGTIGAGTSQAHVVREVIDGLWVLETKTVTTSEWSDPQFELLHIAYVTIDGQGQTP